MPRILLTITAVLLVGAVLLPGASAPPPASPVAVALAGAERPATRDHPTTAPATTPGTAATTTTTSVPATAPPAPPPPPAPAAPADSPQPDPQALHASTPDPCAAMQAAVAVPPPPGWVVRCAGEVAGLMGEMETEGAEIVVYLRPEWSVATAARVYAHELGHAYDWTYLLDADRVVWSDHRGLPGAWMEGCGSAGPCPDLATPAGDWAEVFGEWLVPGTGLWGGQLAPPPDGMDFEVLAALLRNRGAAI